MKQNYLLLLLVLGACCHYNKGIQVSSCPVPEKKEESICPAVCPAAPQVQNNNIMTHYLLGIIGEVEPVYLKNMNSLFYARIDTGAETSSIDAKNITEFERDGESWVSFDVENRETKENYNFKKKIVKRTSITRQQGGNEKRLTVEMEIKIGNQLLTKNFTLADREKFDYQVLIGRNILNGLAIVDVSRKNSVNPGAI